MTQIMKQLPNEDVIYLADTARVPYGSRPPQEIIKINREIIPFLIKKGAKLIIIACGTSSAIAYPVVKDEYPLEMINLIDPGSEAAVLASQSGRIGVMATQGTINSQAFQNKIKELREKAHVFGVGCPLFVPLIEGGLIESDQTKHVAKQYLKPLLAQEIDTLILGCTHYPHIGNVLKELTEGKVALVDPAKAAVLQAKQLLIKAKTLKTKASLQKYTYFVTGSVNSFQEVGSRLLGRPIVGAKQVTLG